MAKKILIADDEQNIRELVRVTLEDEGYEIHEASDGAEALAKAVEVKPDLVVLDVMMPGKTGYEVCEQIKKETDTSHAHIIFLTARGSSVSEMTAEMRGGDEFMTKPFEPMELLERVKKALGD